MSKKKRDKEITPQQYIVNLIEQVGIGEVLKMCSIALDQEDIHVSTFLKTAADKIQAYHNAQYELEK